MIPIGFEELLQPIEFTHFGWYVPGARPANSHTGDCWYLHDDGVVRDYCNDDNFPSTGWFKTENDAYAAAIQYYRNNNQTYPYMKEALVCLGKSLNDMMAADVVESQVMEFV
jgi:hypothetical protein